MVIQADVLPSERPLPVLAVSYDQTIDRRLVHRRAVGEVFVTSVRHEEGGRWSCGVQISRGHHRMVSAAGGVPAIIVMEACRQAGIAIVHMGFKIPLDWQYILNDMGLTWEAPPEVAASGPLELRLSVDVTKVPGRNKNIVDFFFTAEIIHNNNKLGTTHASIKCLSRKIYNIFRRDARGCSSLEYPCSPVSRQDSGDLIVGWDPNDPMVFDHPLDHVPGVALLDAAIFARSFVESSEDGILCSLEASFSRFAETSSPIQIRPEYCKESNKLVCQFLQENQEVTRIETTYF